MTALNLSDEQYRELKELLKIRLTPYIPHVPHPTQHAFLWLTCLEALYGGAAGGGKSDALLMAALQYVDIPGYNAILFRKTYSDLNLPGSLIPRSHEWLNNSDAKWNENDARWTFPSGATLSFGYMRNDDDRHRYQSAEFQFCVAKGTGVLMADGSLKPIETIYPGDVVQTLVGPRPVQAVHSFGKKPTVSVHTPLGENYVSTSHALLTPRGWAAPSELIPIQSRVAYNISLRLAEIFLAARQRSGCLPQGAPPSYGPCAQSQEDIAHAENVSWAASPRIYSLGSRRIPRGPLPPAWRIVPLMLYAPALQLGQVSYPFCCGGEDGLLWCPPQGCEHDYLHAPCSYDELPLFVSGNVEAHTRPLVDAVQPCPYDYEDGLGHAPRHNRLAAQLPTHPYTKEDFGLSGVGSLNARAYPSWARMGQVGVDQEVWDLSVLEASHYIIANGCVAKNCGFDELTHFSKLQYTYMFSRLRKPTDLSRRNPLADVPLRMRGASNPGGRGHLWLKQRFVKPIGSRDDEPDDPTSRVFIPAKLQDNPSVDEQTYRMALEQLDESTQMQLIHGDWDAREPGPWVIPDPTWIDAAVAKGLELWESDDAIPRDSFKPSVFCIDWGEITQAYVLWPMPNGGVYVLPSEIVGEHDDPGSVGLRMLQRAEVMGIKPTVARYDAAGIQSMRTFAKTARAREGWERLKTQKIAFGKYKKESMNYLRLLFKRVAMDKPDRIIAIHPENQVLIRQLRGWIRKDDESEDVEKFDDHGPDALVAGVAPTAAAHRAYIEAMVEQAKRKKEK